MFNISARHRALFEPAPGAAVTAMVYGRLAHRDEPQAVKPASRPSVKPWSLAATPMDQREMDQRRRIRKQAQASASERRVAAMVAAFKASRGVS